MFSNEAMTRATASLFVMTDLQLPPTSSAVTSWQRVQPYFSKESNNAEMPPLAFRSSAFFLFSFLIFNFHVTFLFIPPKLLG
jgi:hypothetical protein